MKAILILILLLGIVISAGCTTTSSVSPAPPGTPHLVGNWTGSLQGYIEGTGFFKSNYGNITLRITEQRDRLFTGQMVITSADGSVNTEQFAGALSHDGKSFTMVQFSSGYDRGTILSANEIELIYIDDNKPATIVIDSFTRIG